ncbi:hypothetical protein ACTQ5F_08210 [Jeotgalibaca porci]|uniref:hypothetical protein n=1 Tax=Jeotgalibaca porci TaxID=1868793 RepID=UPI003F93D569
MVLNVFLSKLYIGNDMHFVKISNSIGFIACTLLGTSSILFFAKVLEYSKWPRFVLTYFGRNSLVVMVTHLEYGVMAGALTMALKVSNNATVIKLLAFFLAVFVEYIICLTVNKSTLRKIFRQ